MPEYCHIPTAERKMATPWCYSCLVVLLLLLPCNAAARTCWHARGSSIPHLIYRHWVFVVSQSICCDPVHDQPVLTSAQAAHTAAPAVLALCNFACCVTIVDSCSVCDDRWEKWMRMNG
jgi:hypothetical protein